MKKNKLTPLALGKQTISHLSLHTLKGGIVPSNGGDCDTVNNSQSCRIGCRSFTCPVAPVYDQQ
jgi:hypothetical protein